MASSSTLSASSIVPGYILWLTDPYSHSDEDEDEDPCDREPRTMYGHPVMVLEDMGKDVVTVCILTTLNGRNIRTHKRSDDYQSYLAIYPKEPPDVRLYPQLCLKNGETLRKAGYLCIRNKHSVRRSQLEPYNRRRPAGSYELSPLSYAVVANTFHMNVPYPEELTHWENASGMCIPIVGPQSPVMTEEVMSDVEATNTSEQTKFPAIEASPYLNYMDHVPATTSFSMEGHRAIEETQNTQDSPTPTEAERPDEIPITQKVPFQMVPCAFVALLMRVVGIRGASTESRVEG